MYTGLEDGVFALLLDGAVDLAARLFDHFLNARGVNTSVGDEALKRNARDLAANGIEARKRDGAGRVVDDEIDARQLLERANVAALAADDTTLHFVAGQINDGDRDLGRVVGGAALNGLGDYLACKLLGVLLDLLLVVHNLNGLFVGQLVLKGLQQVILGLLNGEARNALENVKLALFKLLDFLRFGVGCGELFGQELFFFCDIVAAVVERLLLLGQAALLLLDLVAALADLFLGLGAEIVDLVLSLENGLLFLGLGGLVSVVKYSFGLVFGRTDDSLSLALAVRNTGEKSDYGGNNGNA